MFRVENNVPEVYPAESRDFQLFSRLYDLVFQASRCSIDSMSQISSTSNCNERLLPLLGTKVGFFSNQIISDKTYRHVLSAFPYIIKYKGSRRGIEYIINVFEKIANTSISIVSSTDADLTIQFDRYNTDLELLEELIEYVRPTGFMINYITTSSVSYESDFKHSDKVGVVKDEFYKSHIMKSSTSNYENTVGHTQIVKVTEPQEEAQQ